jgi:hypothetical protein
MDFNGFMINLLCKNATLTKHANKVMTQATHDAARAGPYVFDPIARSDIP